MSNFVDSTNLATILSKIKTYIDNTVSSSGGSGGSGVTPADYVIETGTSGIWTYEKWNSGKLVCWGKTTTTAKLGTSGAGGYYMSSAITVANYPISFVSAPVVTLGAYCSNADTMIAIVHSSSTPTTNVGKLQLWRGNSSSSTSTKYINIQAVGQWK